MLLYILIELHAYDVAGNCTVLFLLQPTQEVHNVWLRYLSLNLLCFKLL